MEPRDVSGVQRRAPLERREGGGELGVALVGRTKNVLWVVKPEHKIGDIQLSNPTFAELISKDPQQRNKTVNQFFGIKGKSADVKKRAQGSLLHMIQDSYAGGHTEREDLGHGRLGAIKNFHAC